MLRCLPTLMGVIIIIFSYSTLLPFVIVTVGLYGGNIACKVTRFEFSFLFRFHRFFPRGAKNCGRLGILSLDLHIHI